MAKSDEILALVRAHLDGDHDHFHKVALCIAANAEKASPNTARQLRALVARPHSPTLITLPIDSAAKELFDISQPTTKLSDMSLAADVRTKIDRFLHEQSERAKLAAHGLEPMRKLLFVGSPGTGKTMMASAIANALSLPMLRVRLHEVIGSYLGTTASNLSKIFNTARTMRGVYFFDEFDALSAQRVSDRQDVGEMRRAVNSLLQFIEDDAHGIIIAATNHVDVVDEAMFRRFDQIIEFPLPDQDVAEALIRSRLLWVDGIQWSEVCKVARSVGHADLSAACQLVNKDAVLADRERISTADLVAAIEARIGYAKNSAQSGPSARLRKP